ncbi:hypothetical protein BpHYR1_000590 [Brachionus plicatilis]|uniref:RNA-directed DNA polymerase from mobile element jockey-like n=1 Tax=Brachionus plicatilis TaxID=10195 RepID=A0A3M7R5V0_BRAPC|nr:hypothetical protein BpHYR1_000590 [Brachionus plicatilis]
MKISVEKSCSAVFSRYKKECDNLNLKIYGNRKESQKEIKFLDYSFPCLNSFSENNIKKLQGIQNTAVRSFLKLKYDTPSNIVHHEAFNKLKLLTVSNRLFELSERYVGTGLSHSIPLVERLVKEYKEGFESRYIEYPTPLSFSSVQKTNKQKENKNKSKIISTDEIIKAYKLLLNRSSPGEERISNIMLKQLFLDFILTYLIYV